MQAQTSTTAVVSNSVLAASPAPASVKCSCASASNPAARKAKRPSPEVYQLHRVNLRSMIESQGKRMLSVDYEKLNGMARTLTGRRGVTAYLKGGENKVVRDSRSYITLFDMQLKEYRTVNLATVTELRCSGKIFRVID